MDGRTKIIINKKIKQGCDCNAHLTKLKKKINKLKNYDNSIQNSKKVHIKQQN